MHHYNGPLIFREDGHHFWGNNLYKGESCFLILGGPSLSQMDISRLDSPYIMTMGVNNSVKRFRPKMWICSDLSRNFLESIWKDPTIQKFLLERRYMEESVGNTSVRDFPNTFWYKEKNNFIYESFLDVCHFPWGRTEKHGYDKNRRPKRKLFRSTMLISIKMLYYFGFKNVYLLGADFHMSEENPYHFEEEKSFSEVKHNNISYKILNMWFVELNKLFIQNNFYVWNCNPKSNLKAFEYKSFEDSVKQALKGKPDPEKEETLGMYSGRKFKNQPGT